MSPQRVAIYTVNAEQLSPTGIQTLLFKNVSQTARMQTSVHDSFREDKHTGTGHLAENAIPNEQRFGRSAQG